MEHCICLTRVVHFIISETRHILKVLYIKSSVYFHETRYIEKCVVHFIINLFVMKKKVQVGND